MDASWHNGRCEDKEIFDNIVNNNIKIGFDALKKCIPDENIQHIIIEGMKEQKIRIFPKNGNQLDIRFCCVNKTYQLYAWKDFHEAKTIDSMCDQVKLFCEKNV